MLPVAGGNMILPWSHTESILEARALEDVSNSDKVDWGENKGLPPGAGCLTHDQVAHLQFAVEEVEPLGPHLS